MPKEKFTIHVDQDLADFAREEARLQERTVNNFMALILHRGLRAEAVRIYGTDTQADTPPLRS